MPQEDIRSAEPMGLQEAVGSPQLVGPPFVDLLSVPWVDNSWSPESGSV